MIDTLLNRLEKVKKTGYGRYSARCPAHEDKSPSLLLRELEDGRILLKCFAECDSLTVLQSIGLDFSDLYPKRLEGKFKKLEQPFDAGQALSCLGLESTILLLLSSDLRKGKALSDQDHERLLQAVARIQAAIRACDHE